MSEHITRPAGWRTPDIEPVPLDDCYTPPTLRVSAHYPAVPFACPETVIIELHVEAGQPVGYDLRAAVEALANVPATARAAAAQQLDMAR